MREGKGKVFSLSFFLFVESAFFLFADDSDYPDEVIPAMEFMLLATDLEATTSDKESIWKNANSSSAMAPCEVCPSEQEDGIKKRSICPLQMLVIKNEGGFTSENVRSISSINNSTKRHKPGSVNCFPVAS